MERNFDEPEDIVTSCIAENYYNKRAKELPPGVAGIFGPEESHEYREKYIQWMEENEPMSFTENDDVCNILNQICISRMEGYERTINEVIVGIRKRIFCREGWLCDLA